MNEMTLTGLTRLLESNYANRAKYLIVGIDLDMERYEWIINRQENFNAKLAYYCQVYNEDLTLKANPKIQIKYFNLVESNEELALYF